MESGQYRIRYSPARISTFPAWLRRPLLSPTEVTRLCLLCWTAKTPLTGGTNGTANAAAHQAALDKFESYSFNTLGCPSDDSTTIKLYINYTKRLRDEVGAKFQTVIFNLDSNEKLADYEGVIEIGSKVTDYDSGISGLGQYGLVYWMTGASAGCAVNKSNTNKKYDGVTVEQGDTKKAVLCIVKNLNVVNAMAQLYMSVIIM